MAPAPTAPPDSSPQGAIAYCSNVQDPPQQQQCLSAAGQGSIAWLSYLSQHQAEATNTAGSQQSNQPAQSSATPTSSHNGNVQSETVSPSSYNPSPTTAAGSTNTNNGWGGGQSGNYPFQDQSNGHGGVPGYLMAVAVIIPLIVLGFIIYGAIRIIRQKRQQRMMAANAPEMKDLNPNRPQVESAYIRPPSSEPPPTISGANAAAVPPTNRQSQPVILSSTMDGAYFTGLDTADHISLADVHSQSSQDTFEQSDEPPPPYRPRSVPPISRETSVRTAYRNSVSRNPSQRTYRNDPLVSNGLMGPIRRSQDIRSPFDDPDEEDDAISEVSTIRETPRQPSDQLSVVSDLSYQDEPVVGHSTV